jgi:glycerophosphoryl diester phosphodiesterase
MGDPIFVYGTLRPASAPAGIRAVTRTLRSLGPARVRGRLYDLGSYPGAVPDPGATCWIEGELVGLGADSPPLAWFDEYEGIDPDDPERGLFRRERVLALDRAGREVACWIYAYARSVAGRRAIPAGIWSSRGSDPRRIIAADARRIIGFAHRGGMAHAPENTLEAFARALALGATGLESDVWLTADGVAVLDHDGEVAVAGVPRPIAELPRTALPRHVPSLHELYELAGREVELALDVNDPAAAPAVVAAARDAGAEERLWLCHWSWRTAAGWRALSRAARLVDSTRARHMRTPPALRAVRMAQVGLDAINLPAEDWRPDWLEVFRREGRLALAWDAHDEATIARLAELGVDGIFGDHVDRLVRVLGTGDEVSVRGTAQP